MKNKLFAFLLLTIYIFNTSIISASEIATSEKETTSSAYDEIEKFNNDEFIVKVNGKKGIINKKGTYLYKPIYQNITQKYSRYLIFQVTENNYFLIDTKNTMYPVIRRAEYISNDWYSHKFLYIPIKNNGKFGIVRYAHGMNQGEEIIPCRYDDIGKRYNNIYVMKQNNKLGLVDVETAEERSEFIYDEIEKISNTNYLKIGAGGKYGLFDTETKMCTEVKFEDVRIGKLEGGSHERNIQVKYNGKWHYIKKGKIVGQYAATTTKGIIGIASVPITSTLWLTWYLFGKAVSK